jgi:hypothetical protein
MIRWVKGEAYHCTACATASVLGVELKDIFNIVGHDGSEIISGVRRGHSFDEMNDVAWYYDKALCCVLACPASHIGNIYSDPGIRLCRYTTRLGIFVVGTERGLHAIAHDGNGGLIDPAIGYVNIDTMENRPIYCYYMVTNLKEQQ